MAGVGAGVVGAVVVGGTACGVAAYVAGPWLLRRIPEPELDEGQTKVPYAALAGRRAASWCGATAAIAGAVLGWRIGWSAGLPAWLALAVAGAVLGYVDLRTRYLPSAIIWPAYLVVGVLLGAAAAVTGQWSVLGRAGIAGVATFAVFYALWWIYPAGVGFGDVRLSGLLGGALGWLGWGEVILGMYGGFVLGAVLGLALTLTKVFDRRAFAFGPFMLAGAVLGVLAGDSLTRFYTG